MAIRYPLILKEDSRRIRCEIRRVFLDIWDPIGIADASNTQDEYDGYIGPTFELLSTGATDNQLQDYLDSVVAGMGMDGSRVDLSTVVTALREINLTSESDASKS